MGGAKVDSKDPVRGIISGIIKLEKFNFRWYNRRNRNLYYLSYRIHKNYDVTLQREFIKRS